MSEMTKFSIAKLDDENYFNWKFRMELVLTKDGLWDVVTAEIPKVRSDAWEKKNSEARILIGLSVGDSIVSLIRNTTTAKEAWDNIQEHFMKDTMSNKVRLIRKICSTKLKEGGNLDKHLQKMNEYFQQLHSMGETKLSETWSVAFLLSSLPDSYDVLVTALETRPEAELTLNLVEAKLKDEYSRRMSKNIVSENEEKYTEQALNTVQKNSRIRCYFCEEPDHIKRDCPKYKDWKKKKESQVQEERRQSVKYVNECEEYLFTTTTLTGGWIVDSGATCHISSNKAEYSELDETFKSEIQLANGSKLKVEGKGTVKMKIVNSSSQYSMAKVEDVFYVPAVKGNLMSVQKLACKGLEVAFERDKCRILKRGREIGIAELDGNVYKLRKVETLNGRNQNGFK